MPEKEPVQQPDDEAVREELKKAGVDVEKVAKITPGVRRCAEILAEMRGDIDELTRRGHDLRRRLRDADGYGTEMM